MKIFLSGGGWLPVALFFLTSTFLAFGATPAAADAVATGLQPGIVYQRIQAVQQGTRSRLDLTGAAELLGLPPGSALTLDSEPVKGIYSTDSLGSYYTSEPDFVGRDQLTFAEVGGTLVIDLKVIPRFLPVAGLFEIGGGVETVGLLDNEAKTLLLCRPVEEPAVPLGCASYSLVDFGLKPLIPVAWPSLRSSLEVPAMVDIETGTVYVLAPRGSALTVGYTVQLPEAGGWPLVGDWRGNGQRSVALVLEDGTVKVPGSPKWRTWPSRLQVPEGDALAWPIVLQKEQGPDAVAFVDPANGDLAWLSFDETWQEPLAGIETSLGGTFAFRLPLSWTMSRAPGWAPSAEIFFLEGIPGDLKLVPGCYRGGRPQTIPVKFPDDPPTP